MIARATRLVAFRTPHARSAGLASTLTLTRSLSLGLSLHRQGIPGPIFNFAVALGVLALPSAPAAGAFLGFVGINAPGIFLKLAVLPLYASWRDKAAVRAVIRGLNATAAGLVFTAVWQLFLVGYIYVPATGRPAATATATTTTTTQAISGPLTADPFWAVVGSGAFVASRYLDAPPWLAVIGGAGAGLAWFGVRSRS